MCVCVSNIAKMCKAWRFKSSYHYTDPSHTERCTLIPLERMFCDISYLSANIKEHHFGGPKKKRSAGKFSMTGLYSSVTLRSPIVNDRNIEAISYFHTR